MAMKNKDIDIALWLSLIIGMLANEQDVYRRDAFAYLKNTGALDYLIRNYEVEHLENPTNVLDNIKQYVLSNSGLKA